MSLPGRYSLIDTNHSVNELFEAREAYGREVLEREYPGWKEQFIELALARDAALAEFENCAKRISDASIDIDREDGIWDVYGDRKSAMREKADGNGDG